MSLIINFFNKQIEKKELAELLSISNLPELKKSEIRHRGKNVQNEVWYEHKKKTLISWINSKDEFEHKHQNKVKKYIKKLELQIDDELEKLLLSLERREFTTRRAFKIIEIPFENEDVFRGKKALLVYKNTKLYDNNSAFMKLIIHADLYMFEDKIVWFNPETKKVELDLELSFFNKINIYDYGLQIIIGTRKYVLRYKDNYIIKISLERLLKKKEIEFNDLTREVKLTQMRKIKENT